MNGPLQGICGKIGIVIENLNGSSLTQSSCIAPV